MVIDATKRGDGVREIRELDVFEVSATPTPMNHDTRVLGWKSADHDETPSDDELRREFEELTGRPPASPDLRSQFRDDMVRLLGSVTPPTSPTDNGKAAEAKMKATGPIQVASFEC